MSKVNMVYVGGPIDLADKETITSRDVVHMHLNNDGITTYNPSGAFHYGGNGDHQLKTINDFALSVADVVLLIFKEKVMTIGTSIELQNARTARRIIIVVSPWDVTPCYIKALADHIFKTQDEAVDFITNTMNNDNKMK